MPTCKDCLCYDVCQYHITEETAMTVNECSTEFKHKDQYVKLPAYIGQKVWVPTAYVVGHSKEIYSGVREGKVSGLQQKADKSWKVRITVNSSVSDYTADEYGKSIFLTEAEADQERRRRVKELKEKYGL